MHFHGQEAATFQEVTNLFRKICPPKNNLVVVSPAFMGQKRKGSEMALPLYLYISVIINPQIILPLQRSVTQISTCNNPYREQENEECLIKDTQQLNNVPKIDLMRDQNGRKSFMQK